MEQLTLPRWVKWSAALIFLAAPVMANGVSFAGNIFFASQYGHLAVVGAAASDFARFTLPIVAVTLIGWTWYTRLIMVLCCTFSIYAAVNVAIDGRFTALLNRTDAAVRYEDNTNEISRMARDLNQITETSTADALAAQIKIKEGEIERHSDPKQAGPCRKTCENMKIELVVLEDRLGKARKREQLEAALVGARQIRNTAKPVEESGLTFVMNKVFGVEKTNADLSQLSIATLLFLLVIESLALLMAPAMRAIVEVARSAPKAAVEVVEEAAPVIAQPTAEAIALSVLAKQVEELTVRLAAPVIAPVVEAPVVLAAPEPVLVLAAPKVEVEAKVQRRTKAGRFAKKPGPKPKKDAPKLKLAELPRPKGANVVDIGSRHKDFDK